MQKPSHFRDVAYLREKKERHLRFNVSKSELFVFYPPPYLPLSDLPNVPHFNKWHTQAREKLQEAVWIPLSLLPPTRPSANSISSVFKYFPSLITFLCPHPYLLNTEPPSLPSWATATAFKLVSVLCSWPSCSPTIARPPQNCQSQLLKCKSDHFAPLLKTAQSFLSHSE